MPTSGVPFEKSLVTSKGVKPSRGVFGGGAEHGDLKPRVFHVSLGQVPQRLKRLLLGQVYREVKAREISGRLLYAVPHSTPRHSALVLEDRKSVSYSPQPRHLTL